MTSVPYSIDVKAREMVPKSKILVVGAGGIGCEVLKNLALSGFKDIEILDLDTIDVSNLNRQFLFRKEHVGKPKAVVARESILAHNPDIQIKAYHDSILSSDYGLNFFRRFNLVLNALDNRTARNHVNRMCLAADIPLIESGTAGYSGQVEFIKKGVTQCYECQPKTAEKSYPGCTIRNTPSEPVHCIVWAKHLFNQVFGEDDPDKDVSPDVEDPNAKVEGKSSVTDAGNVKRLSTRQWMEEINYDPEKLFDKFFSDDIKYLLSMSNLWKERTPPKPLSYKDAEKMGKKDEKQQDSIREREMKVWSIAECVKLSEGKYTNKVLTVGQEADLQIFIFTDSVASLKQQLANKNFLVFDKDDNIAVDFVAACANIRAQIFSIEQKSRFDVKSIAGNIIPAIATANAIIAGLVVLFAFRLLIEQYKKCNFIYLRPKSVHSKFILAADTSLARANPSCYVCSPEPFANVFVSVDDMTVKNFENLVLKNHLNMIAPDVVLAGKGVVVISSEEGETESNNNKLLSQLGIIDGSILKCDDFVQNYSLTVAVNNYTPQDKDDPVFKVEASPEDLKAKEEVKNGKEVISSVPKKDPVKVDLSKLDINTEDPQEGSSSKKRKIEATGDIDDSDDDLTEVPVTRPMSP